MANTRYEDSVPENRLKDQPETRMLPVIAGVELNTAIRSRLASPLPRRFRILPHGRIFPFHRRISSIQSYLG